MKISNYLAGLGLIIALAVVSYIAGYDSPRASSEVPLGIRANPDVLKPSNQSSSRSLEFLSFDFSENN